MAKKHTQSIDVDNDHLISILKSLIEIPSVSENEQAISNYIVQELIKDGLAPKQDEMGNVIVHLKGKKHGKRILLNGHIDTIPPGDGWRDDPYKVREVGNRLYGVGAGDMKGGVAVMLELARVLHLRKNDFEGDIILAFVVGEEHENRDKHGAKHIASQVIADMGIIFEPSQQEDKRKLNIKIGNCGRGIFSVKIFGKSAHSSRPFLGVNSIEVGSLIVQKVKERAQKFKEYHVKEIDYKFRPGFSVTQIKNGKNASNVIPNLCELTVDRRTAPGESLEQITREMKEIIQEIKKESGMKFTYELKVKGFITATQAPIDLPILLSLEKIIKQDLKYTPKKIFPLGATDAGFFEKQGTNMISFGPGNLHVIHKPNEYVDVRSVKDCAKVCLDSILDVLKESK